MNATKPDPSQTLILFVNQPEDFQTSLALPANNLIGTRLLALLLEITLDAAGQLAAPIGWGGPFNYSNVICQVSDVQESAKLVVALLEKVELRSVARLYRPDFSELICRSIYPRGGKDILFEDLETQSEICDALGMALVEKAEKLNPAKPPRHQPASNK